LPSLNQKSFPSLAEFLSAHTFGFWAPGSAVFLLAAEIVDNTFIRNAPLHTLAFISPSRRPVLDYMPTWLLTYHHQVSGRVSIHPIRPVLIHMRIPITIPIPF